MILLVDNFDSFVHNLARHFQLLGQETQVIRNDALTWRDVTELNPDAVVLSPGPCTPQEAGCSLSIVENLHRRFPILGVCLGHQTLAAAFGATIHRTPWPVHGRSAELQHNRFGVFRDFPNPFQAGRYHSLVVDEATLPHEFVVSARTDDGIVMAIQHRELPLVGWQFHPESVLTEGGLTLLLSFLRLANIPASTDIPVCKDATMPERLDWQSFSEAPVTF